MTRWLLQITGSALAAATLVAQPSPQQTGRPATSGTATLSGVVLSSDANAPVRGAAVRLTSSNAGWETTTDAEGRFEFRDLPGNVTTLGVTKSGYVSQTIPLVERGITTLAAGAAVRVEVQLVRGAAIAGRVFDHFGDPVASVTVTALRLYYEQPGQPNIRVAGVAQTTDLGEYRIYGLEPATYFVATNISDVMRQFYAAGPTTQRGPSQLPGFSAPRVPAPTYFPGTTYAADAQPIVVRPGDQVLGSDIRTTNAGMVHIAGRVVDSFGAAVDDTYVILNLVATTGALPNASRVTTTDASGSFAFPGVPPGEYSLHAVALATPLGVAAREKGETSTERGVPEFTNERVAVFGDQTGLQVQTRPGVDVRGRVTVDGVPINPAAGGHVRIQAIPVRLAGSMTNSLLTTEATVNPDGTFTLKNTGGHRVIQVAGLPAGSFLVRVTAGGVDVTDDGVEMREAAAGLGVELTTKPAVLNVSILDASGRAKSGGVVVFAEDPQLWTKFLSRHLVFRTASAGTSRVEELPAGRYLVAALAAANRRDWADPAFLERLRPTATPVVLVAGETRTVTLPWR